MIKRNFLKCKGQQTGFSLRGFLEAELGLLFLKKNYILRQNKQLFKSDILMRKLLRNRTKAQCSNFEINLHLFLMNLKLFKLWHRNSFLQINWVLKSGNNLTTHLIMSSYQLKCSGIKKKAKANLFSKQSTYFYHSFRKFIIHQYRTLHNLQLIFHKMLFKHQSLRLYSIMAGNLKRSKRTKIQFLKHMTQHLIFE